MASRGAEEQLGQRKRRLLGSLAKLQEDHPFPVATPSNDGVFIRAVNFHLRTRIAAAWLCVGGFVLSPAAGADSAATIEQGRAFEESDQLDAARDGFERIAAANPSDGEAWLHLGELALRRNDLEKAVETLEHAAAVDPKNSRVFHRLGDAYGRSAQRASVLSALRLARKCLASYQRAVELDPENLDARYSLFVFYRNAPALIGGGTAKAAAEAEAIRKRDPNRGRVAIAALRVTQKKYAEAQVTLAEVSPIELRSVQGDHAILSDVAWTSAQVGWGQPARNHAWMGDQGPPGVVLIVHGRLYAKGLYAHSPSRYGFDLDGDWKRFTATVGLREGAPPKGSAIFIVRGDGRELFRSDVIRAESSRQIQLDVSGVKTLELITEPAGENNHFSWAIWADPVLRR